MPKVLFDLILLAVFGSIVIMTWTLSANARVIPLMVAVPGLLFTAAQTAYDWVHRHGADDNVVAGELRAVAWMAVLPVLVLLCGFAVGALMYLLVYLRYQAALRWRAAAAIASLTSVSLVVLFEQTVNLPLYRGVLWERLLL